MGAPKIQTILKELATYQKRLELHYCEIRDHPEVPHIDGQEGVTDLQRGRSN